MYLGDGTLLIRTSDSGDWRGFDLRKIGGSIPDHSHHRIKERKKRLNRRKNKRQLPMQTENRGSNPVSLWEEA